MDDPRFHPQRRRVQGHHRGGGFLSRGYAFFGFPRFPRRPRLPASEGFTPSFLAASANDITHTTESEQALEYDSTIESSGSDITLSAGTLVFAKAGLYLVQANCYVDLPGTGTPVQFDMYGSHPVVFDSSLIFTMPLTGLEQDPQCSLNALCWIQSDNDSLEVRAIMRWSGAPGSVDSYGHWIQALGPLLEL